MTWLVIGGLAWTLLALTVAAVLGRGIRVADKRDRAAVPTVEVNQYLRAHGRCLRDLTSFFGSRR